MDEPFNPAPVDEAEIARLLRLQALGQVLATKRDEYVAGRKASGIEALWMRFEEAYLGIDEANRSEFQNARWAKPTSMEGPVTTEIARRDTTKSTAFVRLTSRYVDAGAAKVGEILLPIDDKPFAFEPTPVPELIQAREILQQIMSGEHPAMPAPPVPQQSMPQQVQGAMGAAPGMPPAPPGMPMPASADPVALARQVVEKAQDSAKKAEKRVWDWLVECGHAAEMRKVIFDSARIGTGVLKGPVADVRRNQAVTKEGETVAVEISDKTVPVTRWVDPWNLFPDPECGEDIHNGDGCFERDFLSPRKLKDLKRIGTYLPEQIDKVLKEGPNKCLVDDGSSNPSQQKNQDGKNRRFEVFYYYGVLSREDVMAARPVGLDTLPESMEDIFVVVTIVNDTVIRVVLNPLDSGRFPYRVFPWSRRAGHWTGVGVGEQADVAQRMANAATRAMMNNAGKTAGSQFFIDNELIVPLDGNWTITPDKLWGKAPSAVLDDIRKAFSVVELPDRQQTLMNIIEYAFRLAEESTNIPLISQGQSGPTTPDTYGAAQLQNNNANQLLRNVAATCDDNITEPLINDFYEWLLLDPDVPADEKGDFRINAHGSAALVERAIQDQTIQSLVMPAINPAYGLDPELVMTEYLKSKRIDPRSVSLTDEKKAELANRQPPPPPQVMAAQIRAQAQLQAKQMDNQTEQIRIKRDIDRDSVYVQAEDRRTQNEFQSRREELSVRRELALLEYANKQKLSLDTVKAKLADTAMRLKTQKELAAATLSTDLHKHHNPQVATPAVEPPGRAPAGQAFQG